MVLPKFLLIAIISTLGIVQAIEMLMSPFGIFGAVIGFGISLPLFVIKFLLLLLLHYSCWKLLPAGYRKLDPAATTLALCIPLYNLYWMFVTLPALGEGFDRCLQNNHLERGMDKKNLGIVYACALLINTVLSWLPLVGTASSLLAFIVFLLYYIDILRGAELITQMQGTMQGSQPVQLNPMQRLLRLAQEKNGRLSFAQVSMHMELEAEETNTLLDHAQRYGYAEIGNDPETGAIRYYFDL
ncbi:MAG: hypothetical protein AAGG51_14155 [Cyanobacteria bacterium P01_G01_bin.54]